jgi:hypothetical protein
MPKELKRQDASSAIAYLRRDAERPLNLGERSRLLTQLHKLGLTHANLPRRMKSLGISLPRC